ncbi:L-seryl-tRNA(Sec) selenium transferase [Dethiobacter alkaliphilus]|uniref:L-seryl-tRNA(Sec) selenium transferase n=1 Tax=Dethiobacter alkaliphilus TaxID=427926 RepID=UPI0022277013|nr:L-seryl-tRNA(Sec) selenium transferase [Dethiobacter alkaliphilus]MCW3489469.1 L-seryl-tRNA(Sec) selenium transferase [Dethiobacter alkaliphilus]
MGENWRQTYLRSLPAVDTAVMAYKQNNPDSHYPHALMVQAVQEIVETLRRQILTAEDEKELKGMKLTPGELATRIDTWLSRLTSPSLRRVINATGTVLHTNMGRAALADKAIQAMEEAAGYCNLEMDLPEGRRGSRHEHVEKLLVSLTGAEAACVVNNNAAAVLLCLNTLAAGKKVIVSRGELVEIGGSFRIPDVMSASGAQLTEVGTTNKTHPADYENAVDEETALLLKVHTSNYKVVGFTADVSMEQLVSLGKKYQLPVMEDLGSGLFVDLTPYGLEPEPQVAKRVADGVDVLTLSGDKLLGGPQAGIIVGKRTYIERIRKNQLMRALRPDKVTLAALEATLRIYLTGNPLQEIPVLAMLSVSAAELQGRADKLAGRLRQEASTLLTVDTREDFSFVGGGAMPQTKLATTVVAVRPKSGSFSHWVQKLRTGEPALVGRVQDDWLLLDPRTFSMADEEEVVRCLM